MNLLHSLVKEVSRKVHEFLSQKKHQKIHPKKMVKRSALVLPKTSSHEKSANRYAER